MTTQHTPWSMLCALLPPFVHKRQRYCTIRSRKSSLPVGRWQGERVLNSHPLHRAGQVDASFVEQSRLAKERLRQLQANLADARAKAAPILAKLKDETTEALTAALDEFDEELIRPECSHCEECCDHAPEEEEEYGYGRGYGRYGRGYGGYDEECPEEDCAGMSCSCWQDEAERDFSIISSAVEDLLTDIGTPTSPGPDCQAQSWETAISRVKAVDLELKKWVKNGAEATEHPQFGELCQQCGRAWQTVAAWISDEASVEQDMALDLKILLSDNNDEEQYLPVMASPSYRHALELLQTPWGSPHMRILLTTNPADQAPAAEALVDAGTAGCNKRKDPDTDSSSHSQSPETVEVSKLRLQRLLNEGRHAEALCLAKHSTQIFYQLKALTKVGTFGELAARFTDTGILCSLSCTAIEDLAKYAAAGQPVDERLGAKQQFMFLGAMLVQKSTELGQGKTADIKRLSGQFMKAAVRVQPTGATGPLFTWMENQDPRNVFTKSVQLLQQGEGTLFMGMRYDAISLFAAHLVSLVAKDYKTLSEFDVAGGMPFQATHARETFTIVETLVRLKSTGNRTRYAMPAVTGNLQNLVLLFDLAHRVGDAAMMRTALDVSEKYCEAKDMLAVGKHCLMKVNNPVAATKLARRAYAARTSGRPQVGAVIDFMLTLARPNNVLVSAAPAPNATGRCLVTLFAALRGVKSGPRHTTGRSGP